MFTDKFCIVFIGNNNPYKFKRGVENVIAAQAGCRILEKKYYLFFDESSSVFRWNDIVCIGIKNDNLKYWRLNVVLFVLRKRLHNLIIHSHGPVKTFFLFYKTDILTVHDAIYYQRKGAGQKISPIFKVIEKVAYRKSRKIHFISEYAKKQSLLSKQNEKKSIVIYNTTPLEKVCKDDILFINKKDKFMFFAVRGIQERTRIDLLIDFAKYMEDKMIDGREICIYVAGKGPLLEQYRNRIKREQLTNIFLLGFVPGSKLICYYQQADMVIMTCEHAEGFGLPIIEGYLYNKPVVASNKCAVPEIIYSSDFLFENTPDSILSTVYKTMNLDIDYHRFYYSKYSNEVFEKQMIMLYSACFNKYC